MPPEPPKPSRTRPDLPALKRPESEPPSTPHRDSTSPPKWEIEKSLQVMRETIEANAALREEVATLQGVLDRERKRTTDLSEELESFRRRSKADDEVRDDRLTRLHRRDEELAERMEIISRPKTEATAATTAAGVINLMRNSELRWKALIILGLIILAVLQLLGVHIPRVEPTENVPIPIVAPAGTGYAGRP